MQFNLKTAVIAGVVVAGLVGVTILSRMVTWVNPGYVGVVTQFGSVDMTPLKSGEGPKLISPLQTVVQLPTTQLFHHIKAAAATVKGQSAPTEVTIAYSVRDDMWPKVYATIGGVAAINAAYFDNNVQQALKQVTGSYLAEDLIQKRPEVKERVARELVKAINNALDEKGLKGALVINMIAITDFDFSKDFNDSIDAKVEAEQQAQQAESVARQKATIARASSDVEKKLADARAYSTEVVSQARAEAIRVKGAALKDAAGLIEFRKAEAWNGEVPEYYGGGTLPFIKIDPQQGQ